MNPKEAQGRTEKSVASHLLQKNGILDSIIENNHVFTYYTNHMTNQSKFKLTGRHDAFTFPGYCQNHDNNLFRPIESNKIDVTNQNNNLLFTFRAIFNEFRKKEMSNEGFCNALKSQSLDGFIDKTKLAAYVKDNFLEERDLKYYLETAHQDHINSTSSFAFQSIRFRKTPICISAAISVETNFEMITQALVNPVTKISLLLGEQIELVPILSFQFSYCQEQGKFHHTGSLFHSKSV
jgi:hypothetical protein